VKKKQEMGSAFRTNSRGRGIYTYIQNNLIGYFEGKRPLE
jgi:hypothetical protein